MFTTVQKTYKSLVNSGIKAGHSPPHTLDFPAVTFGPLNLMREGMHKERERKPSQPVLFFFFKEEIKKVKVEQALKF